MPSISAPSEPRRIGEYLPCLPAVIDWAVFVQNAELASGNLRPLGEILIDREQITREDLRDALELQRIDRLRRCSLFERLSGDDLRMISRAAEEFTLAAGERLLSQDQRGDSIYVVISGRVLIYRRDEHLEGIPAGVAVPGDAVGTADYFAEGTRSFSACAVEPAALLRIRYDALPESVRLRPDPDAELERALGGIEDLMDRLTRRACRVLKADRSTLFLVDPENGDLLSTTTGGGGSAETGQGEDQVSKSIRTAGVPGARLNSRFNPEREFRSGDWTRTSLAGPICNPQGEIIGALQVLNRYGERFAKDDEVLFRAYTNEVEAAVENYRQAMARQQQP